MGFFDDAYLHSLRRAGDPKEPAFRDPDALARENTLQVNPGNQVPNTALWAILSMLPQAGGAARPNAQAARRSSRVPAGGQPSPRSEPGPGFTALGDAATRMAIQQFHEGTGMPREELRSNLMENTAAGFERTGSRYARKDPQKVTTGGSLQKVSARDVAHDVMADRIDSAIDAYDPSKAQTFQQFAAGGNKRAAAASARKQDRMVPPGEFSQLMYRLQQLDKEWGGATQPGGGGGEGQLIPDAVAARKMGITPDMVKDLRAELKQNQARTGVLSFDKLTPRGTRLDAPSDEPNALNRLTEEQQGIIDTGNRRQAIQKALADMLPRDKDIFLAHKDPDNPKSRADLAKEYGVSRQVIDKIINRAQKTITDIYQGRGFAGREPGTPIQGSSDAPEWGDKPTRQDKPTMREYGTNPRAMGANPRAKESDPTQFISGMSPRFQGDNPRFQERLAGAPAPDKKAPFVLDPERTKQHIEAHGLRYDGPSVIDAKGTVGHWYTDPETGSTGVIRNLQDANGLRKSMEEGRRKFRENPPKSLGSAANDYQTPLSDDQRDRLRYRNAQMSSQGGGSNQAADRRDITTEPYDVWRNMWVSQPYGISDKENNRIKGMAGGDVKVEPGHPGMQGIGNEPYFSRLLERLRRGLYQE